MRSAPSTARATSHIGPSGSGIDRSSHQPTITSALPAAAVAASSRTKALLPMPASPRINTTAPPDVGRSTSSPVSTTSSPSRSTSMRTAWTAGPPPTLPPMPNAQKLTRHNATEADAVEWVGSPPSTPRLTSLSPIRRGPRRSREHDSWELRVYLGRDSDADRHGGHTWRAQPPAPSRFHQRLRSSARIRSDSGPRRLKAGECSRLRAHHRRNQRIVTIGAGRVGHRNILAV